MEIFGAAQSLNGTHALGQMPSRISVDAAPAPAPAPTTNTVTMEVLPLQSCLPTMTLFHRGRQREPFIAKRMPRPDLIHRCNCTKGASTISKPRWW